MAKTKHIIVIGAGFAGLSTAAYLASAGYEVTVLDKNNQPGGRAHTIKRRGFRFELGPSWYMMPDVFDEFFGDFNAKTSDYYKLKRLDPSYRVFFTGSQQYDLTASADNATLFSQLEPGASVELERLLAKSRKYYQIMRRNFFYLDYLRLGPLLNPKRLRHLRRIPLLKSYHRVIRQYFHDARLQQMVEYLCVLFGNSPNSSHGLYHSLAHIDMNQGVWFPEGGFYNLAKQFAKHARSQGAVTKYRQNVTSIEVKDNHAVAVRVGKKRINCDGVVAACDYHFVETKLLKPNYQSHSESYWQHRSMSSSALIISLGLNTKLSNVVHHNLFLDTNWKDGLKSVYKNKTWPSSPLFYMSVPSKTDQKSAPDGSEVVTIVVPIASGIGEDAKSINSIKQNVYERINERVQLDLTKHIEHEDIRSINYFEKAFNAYKGSGFGLGQNYKQSAILRPKNRSQKIKNLFYAGQDTNPGSGVPLCILSGKLTAKLVVRSLK